MTKHFSSKLESKPKDYFEGTLQIRDAGPEILEWVHHRIAKDRKARIAKEKKVTNGVDLYLSDQHYLQALGRKLQEHHPGHLTVSERQHTTHKMTSKLLYRVTVLYKPAKFKRGDHITLHDEQFEILAIGRTVTLQNLRGGAKSHIKPEELNKAQLINDSVQPQD